MSQKALKRAFRLVLSQKLRRQLSPSHQSREAYEAYFGSVRKSMVLRWLFSRMRLSFPASFEEYALAITALLFSKRGIDKFYLPVEWHGEPLSARKHLCEPSLFLSRHSKFAAGASAINELGGEVVTIAARPQTQSGRMERSGMQRKGRITILPRDRMALLNLRKEMALGKHASCFVDSIDPASGKARIHQGLFEFARICGRPVYFLHFSVNEAGRISGTICGPVDCSDVAAAMERFIAFTLTQMPVLPR